MRFDQPDCRRVLQSNVIQQRGNQSRSAPLQPAIRLQLQLAAGNHQDSITDIVDANGVLNRSNRCHQRFPDRYPQ